MPFSSETLENTFKDLGLTVNKDGNVYLHTTRGRYAPVVSTVITIDEDLEGATLMTTLSEKVPVKRRAEVSELLNRVHGQNLWNVRFHLDESGRVFSIAKFMLWGRPFNATQFGDIFFTSLVSSDRLYPCLVALIESDSNVDEAFEKFFQDSSAASDDSDDGEEDA